MTNRTTRKTRKNFCVSKAEHIRFKQFSEICPILTTRKGWKIFEICLPIRTRKHVKSILKLEIITNSDVSVEFLNSVSSKINKNHTITELFIFHLPDVSIHTNYAKFELDLQKALSLSFQFSWFNLLLQMEFYLSINMKDEKLFVKECIKKTFSEAYILKISFEIGNSFNDSNVLRYLMGIKFVTK